MKKKLFMILALGLLAPALHAQTYSINWYKVAGGGGTSSNSLFAVSGTIGQQDASVTMSGGAYSVTGGFWSFIGLLQIPGAPILSISKSSGGVVVSWPYPSTGFVLQQNTTLSRTSWNTSGLTVSTNNATNSVTIPSPTGNLYFRLVNP
jgi:hypothetical protein